MIVTQAEIEAIKAGRRRQLMIPAALKPPTIGHAYRLQRRPFEKAVLTITVTQVRKVSELSDKDARAQGFYSSHGITSEVWLIDFVRGDRSSFFADAQPRYLGRNTGYTSIPALGLRGEMAAVSKAEQDQITREAALRRAESHSEAIRASRKVIERELAKMRATVAEYGPDKDSLRAVKACERILAACERKSGRQSPIIANEPEQRARPDAVASSAVERTAA